ncbi:MAG: 2OG-Fe(II) oxygenase family protein, partial [Gammaproteobacteria bacterium]|nr:2OG-Fe(II) oxygenase family protein [Gammaproteobacteria bacterium]
LNPHNARAVADLVNAFSAVGENAQAVSLADSFLNEHPGERLVVAAVAQALLNAGDTERARSLTDIEALVQVIDLPAPAGFDDADEFHRTLADELLSDPSLLRDPVNKATTGGAQTGELDLRASNAKTAFAGLADAAIRAAVTTYQQSGLRDHPVMLPATDDWSLRAWGTVIEAGGQQTPHMHPLGWLSAVYYVDLPAGMSGNSEDGWLEFGRPPERLYCKTQPESRRYEPRAGRMVIFPSWFWHRTLTFASAPGEAAPRISIAFDVLPANRLGRL